MSFHCQTDSGGISFADMTHFHASSAMQIVNDMESTFKPFWLHVNGKLVFSMHDFMNIGLPVIFLSKKNVLSANDKNSSVF